MLHVTNGESAVQTLAGGGVGPAIAWSDVLHEGPVPADVNADELCDIRAGFLEECGWGVAGAIAADMRVRNAAVLGAEQVTLWFEHDLYDQLQLVEILALLDGRPAKLAQADAFIGPMRNEEFHILRERVRPVTEAQYDVARKAWAAFRSADASAIPEFLRTDVSCLPYLSSAFSRLLEERPGTIDGLSRTERQILHVVQTGPATFADVFLRTQAMEEAPFAGDSHIMLCVKRLSACAVPLLTTDPWRLTEAGLSVLDGSSSHMELNRVDRWLGGMRFVS
jgi:hypothetical protein